MVLAAVMNGSVNDPFLDYRSAGRSSEEQSDERLERTVGHYGLLADVDITTWSVAPTCLRT